MVADQAACSGGQRVLGIDEAGRGAVIGPLVIAGVVTTADRVDELVRIGTRDSKRFTPQGRERAAGQIREVIDDEMIIVFAPSEIDHAVDCRQLNVLEAQGMAEIINAVCPDLVYIDAVGRIVPGLFISGPGIRNFSRLLRDLVGMRPGMIIEHNADERYPLVAAASVLAKTTRDRLVAELYDKYGEKFGSGYPDKKTVNFIIRYYQAHRCFPEDMRMNWKTRHKLLARITQKKLDDFPDAFRQCES